MLVPGRKFVNAPVRLAANFQDDNRIDVDPTTVKLRVMGPDGTAYTYTYGTDAALVKESTGDYYVDFSPNTSGRWYYRWESTGTLTNLAIEGIFRVEYSPFFDTQTDAYRA